MPNDNQSDDQQDSEEQAWEDAHRTRPGRDDWDGSGGGGIDWKLVIIALALLAGLLMVLATIHIH